VAYKELLKNGNSYKSMLTWNIGFFNLCPVVERRGEGSPTIDGEALWKIDFARSAGSSLASQAGRYQKLAHGCAPF
jgi:hypothetical protein